MSEIRANRVDGGTPPTTEVSVEAPTPTDGAALWRIARDAKTLDLNSSYAYLLWCRDYADTTAVLRVGGVIGGFVTGYRRPTRPDTLVVWQVAVDAAHRGGGRATMLLDGLVSRLLRSGVRYLETTVTAANEPSNRTFTGLARRWNVACERTELFTADMFPDQHEAEFLYRIGPFEPTADHASAVSSDNATT
jgi:L-2,4-diaminobutyric acid acetyltransferase